MLPAGRVRLFRALQSCKILPTWCYTDKTAAKRALSRRTEVWYLLAEFTSLRAGSGDSWPMPSEAKETEHFHFAVCSENRNIVQKITVKMEISKRTSKLNVRFKLDWHKFCEQNNTRGTIECKERSPVHSTVVPPHSNIHVTLHGTISGRASISLILWY